MIIEVHFIRTIMITTKDQTNILMTTISEVLNKTSIDKLQIYTMTLAFLTGLV